MTSPIPSEPRTGHKLYHAAAIAPVTASWVVATAVLTFYVGSSLFHAAGLGLLVAMAIAYLLIIVGVGVLIWKRGAASIGLRAPNIRFIAAAMLVGVALWYVNLRIIIWLDLTGDGGTFNNIIDQTPLIGTLLGLAVLPAVAEELVFRGVFTRSLATRFHAGLAILISAAVFAAYHREPAQMTTTFVLGLALGFLTLRARSVIPAMIAHLFNNTVGLMILRDEMPTVTKWMSMHPSAMLAGSTVLVACGLALAARGAV